MNPHSLLLGLKRFSRVVWMAALLAVQGGQQAAAGPSYSLVHVNDFAITVPSVLYLVMHAGLPGLKGVGLVTWGSMNSFTLTAIPLSLLVTTLVFRLVGALTGTDGCNRYSTSYTVDGDAISFAANGISTMMACPKRSACRLFHNTSCTVSAI